MGLNEFRKLHGVFSGSDGVGRHAVQLSTIPSSNIGKLIAIDMRLAGNALAYSFVALRPGDVVIAVEVGGNPFNDNGSLRGVLQKLANIIEQVAVVVLVKAFAFTSSHSEVDCRLAVASYDEVGASHSERL